jgi:hypothetical protein
MRYALIAATFLLFAYSPGLPVRGQAKPKELPIKNAQVNLDIYGPWKDGIRNIRPWSEAVGERVVAEGLAWGEGEKGLGQHLVLDGAHVYIDKIDFSDNHANGKLVRVRGILRVEVYRAPRGKEPVQAYVGDFRYYTIDADKCEIIDRVKFPYLFEAEPPKN